MLISRLLQSSVVILVLLSFRTAAARQRTVNEKDADWMCIHGSGSCTFRSFKSFSGKKLDAVRKALLLSAAAAATTLAIV